MHFYNTSTKVPIQFSFGNVIYSLLTLKKQISNSEISFTIYKKHFYN